MKKINYFFLICIALTMSSCCEHEDWWDDDNDHHVEGKGEIKTESISLSDFTGIDLRMVADVNISTGRPFYIDFTAHENILKYMNARVVDNILILEFDHNTSVSSDEYIRIDISMPAINDVYLKGVGDIYIHGPEQEHLNIYIDGVGDVDAFNLAVKQSNIKLNGKGDVKIRVSEILDVIINGIGNVYYKGSPSISSNINGIGDLVRD
jgi:hypothetical protein